MERIEEELTEELSAERGAVSEEVSSEGAEQSAERGLAEVTAELNEVKIKLELLLAGVDKERLAEGVKLACGLCGAGRSPAEAAAEVAAGYPHLRAVRREIPQISAQGGGKDDGFSAIRRIFASGR